MVANGEIGPSRQMRLVDFTDWKPAKPRLRQTGRTLAAKRIGEHDTNDHGGVLRDAVFIGDAHSLPVYNAVVNHLLRLIETALKQVLGPAALCRTDLSCDA